jgi:nitronate monooxygenase
MGYKKYSSPRGRVEAFTGTLGIRLPILLAPMAGACPPSLSIAIANAGGLGACGTLLMEPEAIKAWSAEFRRQSQGEFQLNLWIPGPVPVRDFKLEKQQREYLAAWGPRSSDCNRREGSCPPENLWLADFVSGQSR